MPQPESAAASIVTSNAVFMFYLESTDMLLTHTARR